MNCFFVAFCLLLLFAVAPSIHAASVQDWNPDMSTYTSCGKSEPVLNGYKEVDLLDHKGSGCLTHMWFGGQWPGYEKTRIRVYVDGETSPSIDMQLGMGVGVGFADSDAPWGSEKMRKTGAASGIYNTYRLPYGKSVRVTAQRSTDSPDGQEFWWIIRGTDGLRVELGGVLLPAKARLKLYTVDNVTTKPLDEVTMCDVKGPGAVYEVAISAKGLSDTGGWHALSFMEGCIRGYINGAQEAELLSSGFEDFFTGTYYFQKGKYANSLAGVTHFDTDAREVSAYRFFDDDPMFFQKSLRLTCRNGDTLNGTMTGQITGDPPDTDFTTYVWVYEW